MDHVEQGLITAEQLADRLGISERRVRELARAGRIPEVRISERVRRFEWAEVLEALREDAAKRGGASHD